MFGISIVIRLPFLNRPLGMHHEWLTAQTLVIHSAWYQRGIASCGFNPIVTFALPADKNIFTPMGKIASPAGDYYYTSQPPFGYIFPYLVLTSLGIRPEILPLEIFNLFVHLACVILVFAIIRRMALRSGIKLPELPAIVGAAVYTFMPVALWFHGNVYGFEILVQMFFLLGIYLFMQVLERPARPAWMYIALAANAFFMSYTESLGVFFAFAVGLYALFNLRDKMMRAAALFVFAGTAAALCLTFFQYSQIAGAGEFINRLFSTYLKRSGLSNRLSPASFSFSSNEAWARVWSNYSKGFGWFLAVFALTGAVTLVRNIVKRTTSHFGKMEFAVIWITIFPVLLHHVIFFNFTAIHDYSVLKDTVFFSLFAGILCSRLMLGTRQPVINGILAAAFIGSLLFGINQFWKINNNSSDRFKKTGELIAHTAQPDEVVFVAVPDESCAHIVFYAQRNIAEFWQKKDARELIAKNRARRGIIFNLDEDYNCTGYRYLE